MQEKHPYVNILAKDKLIKYVGTFRFPGSGKIWTMIYM